MVTHICTQATYTFVVHTLVTRTCVHARIHTHTNMHTRTRTYTHTHSHTHIYVHTYIHIRAHTQGTPDLSIPEPPTAEGWLTNSFPPQLTDPTNGVGLAHEQLRLKLWMSTVDPYVAVPNVPLWSKGPPASVWRDLSNLVAEHLSKKVGSEMSTHTIDELKRVVAEELPNVAERIYTATGTTGSTKAPRDRNSLGASFACVSTALTRKSLGIARPSPATPLTPDQVNNLKMQTLVLVKLTIALAGSATADARLGKSHTNAGIVELMGACVLVRFYSLVPAILRGAGNVCREYISSFNGKKFAVECPPFYCVGTRWMGHVEDLLEDLGAMAAGDASCAPASWEDSHEMFFMGTARLRLEGILLRISTGAYADFVQREPWAGGQRGSPLDALRAAHGAVFAASSQSISGEYVVPDALYELAAHTMVGVPGVVERNPEAAARHLIEGWKRGSARCAETVASGAIPGLASEREAADARVVAAVMGSPLYGVAGR
eukprot:Opistho-2@20121